MKRNTKEGTEEVPFISQSWSLLALTLILFLISQLWLVSPTEEIQVGDGKGIIIINY